MNAAKDLNGSLAGLRKRVRLLLAEKYGLWGLAVGCAASAILVLISPKAPILLDYRLWWAVPILASAAGVSWGLAAAAFRNRDLLAVVTQGGTECVSRPPTPAIP